MHAVIDRQKNLDPEREREREREISNERVKERRFQ
jgi:hypothetical protein